MAVIDFPRRAAGIPGDLRQLSRDWLDHKRARSAAANTLAAYAADLELLAEFLARRDITLVQHVSEYLLDQWLDQACCTWAGAPAPPPGACPRCATCWPGACAPG